jgi:hypothetical protein
MDILLLDVDRYYLPSSNEGLPASLVSSSFEKVDQYGTSWILTLNPSAIKSVVDRQTLSE